ncbi:MAG TPA: response regulator [Candidatus Acidoferrales bacterium]|nr:response regulator [Candidatus Acidoferrales bacterium]
MKILLVACDAAVLQYLEKLLHSEGSEVSSMLYENPACATRAIERADAQQFDAVFVDFRMPSLSGVELCAQIKRVSPHTRTILMSTPIPPEGRAHLLSQGVTSEFFVEPSVLQNLRDALGMRSQKPHNREHPWF